MSISNARERIISKIDIGRSLGARGSEAIHSTSTGHYEKSAHYNNTIREITYSPLGNGNIYFRALSFIVRALSFVAFLLLWIGLIIIVFPGL